jgi:hypothetical protein
VDVGHNDGRRPIAGNVFRQYDGGRFRGCQALYSIRVIDKRDLAGGYLADRRGASNHDSSIAVHTPAH